MGIFKTGPDTARNILAWTQTLLAKFPTRIPGSGNSAGAGREIAADMRRFCDSVQEDEFSMHPGALFLIGKVLCVGYGLSLALLGIGGICTYISFFVIVITFLYAFVEYFLYGRLFDPLFPKATGVNAVGAIEPSGEVLQQVVVCGHHDSTYEFELLCHLEFLSGVRFLLAILFYLYLMVLSGYAAVQTAISNVSFTLSGTPLVLALAGLVFTLPLFFFVLKKECPGAGDNANGTSIALAVGRHFSREKTEGYTLRNTRIVILSTDGEEAGQRGAIAYAEKHREELKSIQTFVFNIDSIYEKKALAFMARDRHGFQKLSGRMLKDCMHIAGKLGYRVKTVKFPFGSGTDAASFAAAGANALSIIAMPTSLFEKEYVYHTQKDTVERIEPGAVEAVFNIAVNYIRLKDETSE